MASHYMNQCCQAIIWTNIGPLIGPLGTNFSETLIKINTFSFKKMHFKMLSGKWQPFCLGLNALISVRICIGDIRQSYLFSGNSYCDQSASFHCIGWLSEYITDNIVLHRFLLCNMLVCPTTSEPEKTGVSPTVFQNHGISNRFSIFLLTVINA